MYKETVTLEENWNEIKRKVIEPLWRNKFKSLYIAAKLDIDDFESLANLELTKAFKHYDSGESNVLTFATNVLQRKAKSELTFYHRQRRIGDIEAESMSQITDEDGKLTLEDIIIDDSIDNEEFEGVEILKNILKSLKDREKRMVMLSIQGYDDKEIAHLMHISTKDINQMRDRLKNTSSVRRMLRKLGYLGGEEQ